MSIPYKQLFPVFLFVSFLKHNTDNSVFQHYKSNSDSRERGKTIQNRSMNNASQERHTHRANVFLLCWWEQKLRRITHFGLGPPHEDERQAFRTVSDQKKLGIKDSECKYSSWSAIVREHGDEAFSLKRLVLGLCEKRGYAATYFAQFIQFRLSYFFVFLSIEWSNILAFK